MSTGLAGVERGRRRVATLASGVEGAEKRQQNKHFKRKTLIF